MKNILIICIFAIMSCNAQQVTTIVSINEVEYPNGAYLKDLDDVYLPFIGTWKGVKNNIEYTIKLVKFTQHLQDSGNGNYYFEDVVKGDLKIIDLTTNTILYNKLAVTDFEELRLFGISTPHGRNFRFIFWDTDEHCNNEMQFTLQTVAGNPNQLKYYDFEFSDGRTTFDCPQYQTRDEIPRTIPSGSFMLIKI